MRFTDFLPEDCILPHSGARDGAGVLHEVRNPVNAILNAARVLSEGPTEPDTARRLLAVVSDCAGRIHQLTQSLDAHARPADGGAEAVCDVSEGLDATLSLLSHRLHSVRVLRTYSAHVLALAPAGPLNQIFLNLLDNALVAGAKQLEIDGLLADTGAPGVLDAQLQKDAALWGPVIKSQNIVLE